MPLTTMCCAPIFVLFALGLNIVVGFAGLLDLGYVAFFLFGAYIAAWLMSDFFFRSIPASTCSTPPSRTRHPASTSRSGSCSPIAAMVAALAGIIIGAPTLRLKSDYLALVTLGFGEILPQVFRNGETSTGFNLTNGTKGIGPVDRVGMGFGVDCIRHRPKTIVSRLPTKYYVIFAFCGLFVFVSLQLVTAASAGMAGHPRGRAGGEPDGRAADAHQAVVVRRRCRGRRRRRRVLRD